MRILLRDFDCFDDGIPGERVTPTGAAIVKVIASREPSRGKLRTSGAGFGQRQLSGTSNCVWLSVFEDDELMLDMITDYRVLLARAG